MKKLLAGLIILIMLGGIFGFAPSIAHASAASEYLDVGPLNPPPQGR
jgi:hypothetical protein